MLYELNDPEQAEATPTGQLEPGNIDLHNRPIVKNPDGSISTVRSISIGQDGKEVLIPTVAANGSGILSNDAAISQYKQTGQHLGIFDTPENATARAQAIHQEQQNALNMKPPVPWQTVSSDPAFKSAPAEDKLVAFSRWHDNAYNYAKAQPDWAQHEANFNQSASEIQGDLSKEAGGITPDQAKQRVAEQAVAAAGATNGQQVRDALRPYGPDIWRTYLDNRVPAADETILGNVSHELVNAGREMKAHIAKFYAGAEAIGKNTLSGISDQVFGTNIAVPDKKPDVEKALTDYDQRIKNAQDTLAIMPPDHADYERTKNEVAGLQADRSNFAAQQNAKSEVFANAVADLHNTLANIDPEFHVDQSLKNTLSAKLGGVVGDIAPAFTPGVGLPVLLLQSGVNSWAQKYDQTGGDARAADAELVKTTGINLLFMGLAHGANSLLTKALAGIKVPVTAAGERAVGPALREPVGAATSLAVRAAGGSAANAVIGQAIAGAEAAKDAPEGEKFAAFSKAFNSPEGSQIAQAIGFGILGAKPIESLKAAAVEAVKQRNPAQTAAAASTAVDTAVVNNLEATGAPQTAQVAREDAIQRRAGALRAAMNPELRQQNLAAGAQENFVEGTFPTETAPVAPAPPAIRLVSAKGAEGDYSHNLSIAPEATVEQLEAWKSKVDLSHLPPEARTAAIEQIDAAIAERTAPAEATAQKRAMPEIAGPVLVDAEGKILARGTVGETHEDLMRRTTAELEKSGAPVEQINAVLDAAANDAQHKFADTQGNVLDRAQGAQVAVAAGQAPEGTTNLHSQMLVQPAVAATRAVGRTYNEAPLPSAAEVARLAARSPEEKAAQVEQGTKTGLAEAEATGLVPILNEAHRLTGDRSAGKDLRTEITKRFAKVYPAETLPEGTTEIPANPKTDRNSVTGDILRFAKDVDGVVRPVFTNNPQDMAQHIDNGTRVVIPEDMVKAKQVNPAIKYTIDAKTGEYIVTDVDVKLPNGRVINVDAPEQFSQAYKEARIESSGENPDIYRFAPDELAALQEKIQKGFRERGLDVGPLEFDMQENPGNVDVEPGSVAIQSEPSTVVEPGEHVAMAVLSNHEALDRLGILKPDEVQNPIQVALKQIVKDIRLSAGQRVLANILLKSKVDWSGLKLRLVAKPNVSWAGEYRGGARADKGTMDLNVAASHKGGIASSLLHEAIHHLTLRKMAPDYARNPFEERALNEIQKHYDKALQSAYTKENGRAGTPKELSDFAKAQSGDKSFVKYKEKSQYYGLSDVKEFVAETLSSEHFQDFLKTVEGAGTVRGKIGNLLNSIRQSLKDLVSGKPVVKGSLFDNAYEQAVKLLKHPQETERIGAGSARGNLKSVDDMISQRARDLGLDEDLLIQMSKQEIADYVKRGGAPNETYAPSDKINIEQDGWLAPDGKFYAADIIDGGHYNAGLSILNENTKLKEAYEKALKKEPNKFLESRSWVEPFMEKQGYVRILGGGPEGTSTYITGQPTAKQKKFLIDAAQAKGKELVWDREGKIFNLFSPTAATRALPRPEITHEVDETGKVTHDVKIPEGTNAEDLRGALNTIAKSSIPDTEKARLQSIVAEKLGSFKVDQAANRFTQLQDEIAAQPDGQPTAAQSAELNKIKAEMPEVVDHPQVQRSAQALGIIPGYLDINDRLATHFHAAVNWLGTVKPANWWSAWYNAAENKAVIFATQKVNDVRGVLREAMNRSNTAPNLKDILKQIVQMKRTVNTINARDERALSFVVESQNNPANLDVMRQKIKGALAANLDRGPSWYRAANQALDAIDHAEKNYARLSIAADIYTRNMQDQVRLENAKGIATNYRNGYVPHIQDMETNPDTAVLFGGGSGGTAGVGFKKMRTHATFADSISEGVTPKTLNALDAMENRIKRGVSTIGRQEWAEAGKALIDPITNSPVVADVVVTDHPQTGDKQTSAPNGYVLKLMGNRQIAVHQQYSGLFDAFTQPSRIRGNLVGNAALQTAGFVKHGLLLFDTFHLGRLAYYQGALRGKSTFSKGLLSLDYSDKELQNMERRGDLPQGISATDMIARKNKLQVLIDSGFNLGGIQEAVNAGFTRKLPVVGDFNKFVFEQFQRGGMAESGLIELERQTAAFPELSPEEVARKVSKELNTRFGNLKKEGWLKSDTMADLVNLVFLAPHWNEGLIKSEVGAASQLVKAGKDLTLGYKDANGDRVRTARAGSLLKGSGTLFIGVLAMNQIINYMTRGVPTWQNPEEGLNAKISAWIPDKIGGGPGFFLNPFTLPGEITHQVLEQKEKGANTLQALVKVAGYKLGAVGRNALTIASQTDRFGRPLYNQSDVLKEMIGNLTPIPIFGSALYAAVTSLGNRKVKEPYKGAIEKQVFSTAGIKLSGAPSDAARIGRLAKEYLKSIGAEKNSRYTGSDYQTLKEAIQSNDPERAQKEYEQLLKTKSQKTIDKYFRDQVRTEYTGSKKHEAGFRDTLSSEQQKAYERAIDARAKLRDAYFDLNLTAP